MKGLLKGRYDQTFAGEDGCFCAVVFFSFCVFGYNDSCPLKKLLGM